MHGRHEARPGPLATPIVQTSTFTFGSAAEMRRHLEGDEELFLYTRYANPTVRELEESLAAVEDAEAALALSSGMAAMTTAVASIVRAGDEVLASASLYGGTVRLLTDLLPRFGVTARFVAARRPRARRPGGGRAEPRADRGEPDQPRARDRGPRGGLRLRARAGPRGRRRQHLRHPAPPAAPRPRGRPRHAQPDQGPRRPQRRDRGRPRRVAGRASTPRGPR